MGSSRKHREKEKEKDKDKDKDKSYEDEHRRRDKNKEKGKEKSEKHSRRARSKSRERDKIRSGRDKDRERDRDKDKDGERRSKRDRDKNRERDRDRERERDRPDDKAAPEAAEATGDTEITPKSASGNNSLSIEETNKLRAKLGLKPLEVNVPSSKSDGEEDGTNQNPAHMVPVNLADIKKRAELKERLAAFKEKRLLNKKLGKVRTLGVDDEVLDDAFIWVEHSRKLQKEKELADKRAKLLEEMDEEFGVSNLVEEELGTRKKEQYSSQHLGGLKVEHSMETFIEGERVILTLKDKGVLDEEEDVLQNVNIVDSEKAEKNVQLKKKKPDYLPFDETEAIDGLALIKPRSLLSKYDEEIEGEKKQSFRLDNRGEADGSWERELQRIRETLRDQSQSLDMAAPRIASEFYTHDEMVKFKTTKRRVRKIRKKKMLKADELEPIVDASAYLGSRTRSVRRNRSQENDQNDEEQMGVRIKMERDVEMKTDKDFETGGDMRIKIEADIKKEYDDEFGVQVHPVVRNGMEDMEISDGEDASGPEDADMPLYLVEEDPAELELQKQLDRQRKLQQKKAMQDAAEKVAWLVKSLPIQPESDEQGGGEKQSIVFNSTSEFCRTLGEIPTYGMAGNRDENKEAMDIEQSDSDMSSDMSDEDNTAGWNAVDVNEREANDENMLNMTTILEEEPVIASGLSAALKLCNSKGYLDTKMQRVARVKAPKTLPSSMYTIEDKSHADDKYSRREEYRGYGQDFKEKDCYRPDIRIEYVDDTGRKLNPKEAFRQLSHRFHGKGSGKMKTEKRMKKHLEEQMLKKMSSSDTPLGTVALLQEKQKSQKTPFIILSGSGKSMNANSITK
uniref:U4/U6.U5 tri-snRNP-associated protein 1 n=1 Tax=Myxine glutinosa TaxID=7769 RepID=UPI00358FE0C4